MKRYPGIRPFRTDEKGLFFGRDADIERLHRLIGLEQLVILYGKSGYGKSSLLSAGIFPRLQTEGERQFLEIRFGPHKPGDSLAPTEATRHAFQRADTNPVNPVQKNKPGLLPQADPSLWLTLKNRQQTGQNSFLLVFDQFEELFSYPADQILEFKKQLAEALYSRVPKRYETALADAGLTPEQEDTVYAPFDLKVVFSIRSDRMSLLNGLKDYLPNLLQHGYELEALDEAAATEAVCRPAALNPTPSPSPKGEGGRPSVPVGDSNKGNKKTSQRTDHPTERNVAPLPPGGGGGVFDTPPFTYAPAALAAIFAALRNERGRIETSALQIVCRYVEDNVVGGRQSADDGRPLVVQAHDLGDIKSIFRQFYERTIENLPGAERGPARRLVEDLLIKDGTRIPYAAQALLATPGVGQELLDRLAAASLLRVERDEQGRMLYEVGHDTLVAPIEEAAKARREDELREAERERLRLEAERQQAEQQKIARARRRNLAFSAVALLLLGWALWQNIQAGKQKTIAAERTAAAEAAERRAAAALDSARAAQTRADTAQAVAARKTEEARISADATARAMLQLGHSTAQVVDALVKEVNGHIFRLEYPDALGKLEAAAKFNKRTPDFARAALELAFFYNEADNRQAGARDQALALLGQPRTRSREACREYLRRADPVWYKTLEARYYPVLLPVSGGEFWMGCDSTVEENCGSDEKPRHRVRLNDYELAETETTNWQYALFSTALGRKISDNQYEAWGAMRGNDPVINVSWYDAVEYANWLSARFGRTAAYEIDSIGRSQGDGWDVTRIPGADGFCLPTEAEWEYAARGGPKQTNFIYAGADRDALDDVAWWQGNSSRTNPVRTKRPNTAGFYDMTGNVWEWCHDKAYYNESPGADPIGPKEGEYRCLRGGSWNVDDYGSRLVDRNGGSPYLWYYLIGFRLARHF
ncbi:MAG: SUMF1/EgtB/PvdO family nonheme iron enzyme [Lewinellaceae bacterium]|nr:SUMF1/EgtB/PvdO family nonheme iron enzyme [Lewinellaceae bacterium]